MAKKLLSGKHILTPRENMDKSYDVELVDCNLKFVQDGFIQNIMKSSGFFDRDIRFVLNFRDAWKFVLDDTIKEDINLMLWNHINFLVGNEIWCESGMLRSGPILVNGFKYELPVMENDVKKKIADILASNKSATERGIDLFLYGCVEQNYSFANKRTSGLVANKFLIMNGAGIMLIRQDDFDEFQKLLKRYRDAGDCKVKQFLYDKTIIGELPNTEAANTESKVRI